MGWSAPTTLSGWVALGVNMGLNPSNYIPASMYAQALLSVQRNIKSASNPPSAAQFNQGQAMIIVRGLIYQKSNPGDCGTYSTLDLSGVGLAQRTGSVASGVLSTVAKIGGSIGSIAGAALPGIGVAVQAITDIFANHARAVATEQETLCSVAGVINQVIPYYDAQVRSGAISPGTAIQGVQNFIQQVNAQLETIYKSCNAACVYMSFLAAHADFLNYYYPAIAPAGLFSVAPGSAPTSNIITSPGGVMQSGNVFSDGLSTAPGVASSSQLSSAMLIGIFVVIGILILAFAR